MQEKMDEKIEPALTPEEWKTGKAERNGVLVFTGGYRVGLRYVDPQRPHDPYADPTSLDVDGRHALAALAPAALALRGQPFGFTWEMVDALRECVNGRRWAEIHADRRAAANGAINRIAALLPPREGK